MHFCDFSKGIWFLPLYDRLRAELSFRGRMRISKRVSDFRNILQKIKWERSMIEIKGKDGSIQIEKKLSRYSDSIVYIFHYKSNDIHFSSKEIEGEGVDFLCLYFDLKRLLNNKPYFIVTETFIHKPDSALKKLVNNLFSFSPQEREMQDFNKCSFRLSWPYDELVILDFESVKESSEFLMNFTFFYDDVGDIKLNGCFLISKDALTEFNQQLYQFISLKL